MANDAADVVKNIKSAKPNPIGFAFGLAGAPADHVLLAERGKTGDQLVALAKKQSGVKQSCGGTVIWDGSEAVFSCEHPVSGLEKLIEGWVRTNKVSLKTSVLAGKAAIEKATEKDEEEDEEEDSKSLFSEAQVERRLKQSKTKEMNFAFGLAGGKEKNLLALHPLKDGEKLFRMIKAENGAVKKCWGKVTLDGAVAVFTCEEGPIPSMKRLLRALFKEWKLAYRVQIMGPEGEVKEPGDEEDEDEAPIGATGTGPADQEEGGEDEGEAADPQAIAALRQELAALLPQLQAVAKTASSRARVIREFYQACEKALNAGRLDPAQAALARLHELAEEGGDLTAAADGLRKELEALLPKLKPIVANDKERGPIVRETYASCDKALKAGDAEEGQRLLTILHRMAGETAETAGGGAGVLDRWKRVRAEWSDAIDTIDHQISALQTALKATDDEDLEAIAEYGLNAITGNFKVRMMAAMMDLDRADQAGFAKAAPKALGVVQNFQKHLESDERVAAVDENPFGVSMSLRKTLGDVLTEMEQVLKAA